MEKTNTNVRPLCLLVSSFFSFAFFSISCHYCAAETRRKGSEETGKVMERKGKYLKKDGFTKRKSCRKYMLEIGGMKLKKGVCLWHRKEGNGRNEQDGKQKNQKEEDEGEGRQRDAKHLVGNKEKKEHKVENEWEGKKHLNHQNKCWHLKKRLYFLISCLSFMYFYIRDLARLL